MVLETTETPIKRGRWRPRKNPLPENTNQTASSKKATTAKTTTKAEAKTSTASLVESKKTVLSKKDVWKASSKTGKRVNISKDWLTREEELAAFESRSNKSGFLTLLILVLGIALIWYGMYQKINQTEKAVDNKSTTTVGSSSQIDNTTNGNTTQSGEQNTSNEWGETVDQVVDSVLGELPANDTSNLIWKYFAFVNEWNADKYRELQDSSFNTLSALRTYFNTARLETFINNTVDWIHISDVKPVTDDPALQRNPTAKVYDFTMSYALRWESTVYTDAWRWYTVEKGTGESLATVINGFVYQGNSASNSPFFQFTKFNIR